MTESRILGRVEFPSSETKDYYYKKAKELGYSSFRDFAIAAMDDAIASGNPVLEALKQLAEISSKMEEQLQYEDEFTPELGQAYQVFKMIYSLVAKTHLMQNAPENIVVLPLEMRNGSETKRYKQPLIDNDSLKTEFERLIRLF